MCVIADEGSGSSRDAIATARTILRRIARCRAEKPASCPAEHLAQVGEAPRKRLKECLDAAVSSPGK